MALTKVPNDPTMPKETRAFLDDIVKQINQPAQQVTDITCETLAASVSIDGKVIEENNKRVLTVAAGQELEAGFTHEVIDHGVVDGGVLTIDIGAGFFQSAIIRGSVVLQANNDVGCCVLTITNSSATGLTFGGSFTMVYPGPSYAITNGNKYAIYIYGFGSDGTDVTIQPRQ